MIEYSIGDQTVKHCGTLSPQDGAYVIMIKTN